jgi:putative addiction module component (TIGR02574 family)
LGAQAARALVSAPSPKRTLLRAYLIDQVARILEQMDSLWYWNGMPQGLKELTEEALRLPPDDRVLLAESLLLTIDEDHNRIVDEAIMKELERRLQDFREGKVKGVPADEAFRRIRETLKNRS